MAKHIVIVGTLDTKELEVSYVQGLIEKRGHIPVIIDCGVMKDPSFEPTISRHAVAEAAGTTIAEILKMADKNHAIGTMWQRPKHYMKRETWMGLFQWEASRER